MTAYLKIENPGVCPVEGFTLLGASSKSKSSSPYCIGQFGSGNKHAAGVLLRAKLPPIVFCSNHKLTFTTQQGVMKAVEGNYRYDRIVIKHGGQDDTGKSCTFSEPLSQTSNYGNIDWEDIEMALREYVSNAIDATIIHNEKNNVKANFPFMGVEIAIVAESDVRAKKGFTRVFIPLTGNGAMPKHETAILSFYQNIGKWFLHFSEPWSINKEVLLKKERNIKEGVRTAVIYRRGVRVREIDQFSEASLFDYNLNNLRVDESRNVDDYVAKCAAMKALANAPAEQLATWLRSFVTGISYWEHHFDSYSMTPSYSDSTEVVKAREANWASASRVIGENLVLCGKNSHKDTLARKGYKTLEVPESVILAGMRYGLTTPEKVLDADERSGWVIVPATEDAKQCASSLWDLIVKAGMHRNKKMPAVECFQSVMDGGCQVLGFQRDGTVYVNQSIAVGQGLELQQTMLEEMAHYITGALDETRDLQDWAFGFAVKSRSVAPCLQN